MTFGPCLSRIRRSRRWSQEELANRAGLSQRHLSFLETGRAQPGDQSLNKLAKALALKGWEHRALLGALVPFESKPRKPAYGTAFIQDMVSRASHWPAYAFKPDGSLLATNAALDALLAAASPIENLWTATAPPAGPNVYDLVFHPKGLVRWMENPSETLPETLRRLRIEASQDQSVQPALNRAEAYAWSKDYPLRNAPRFPVLTERYKIGDSVLAIISVISHLASPGEIELDNLRIETFVPADKASEAVIRSLCDPARLLS